MSEHATDCRERKARESAVGIECEHGYDVCPTCDPCTCEMVCNCGSPLDGSHDHVTCGPPVPAEANKG